jgi:Gpi18-like mannosyltransferase
MRNPGSSAPPTVESRERRSLAAHLRGFPYGAAAIVAVEIALAVALRYTLLDFKSADFFASLKPWYNTIKSEGFSAFATGFSTYNPPYLYLLYLIARFLPDTPIVVAIKLPALISDFICAYLVFLIVRLKFAEHRALPLLASMAVLLAPSVVLNSAFWGQADSLFTAALLACIYSLMTHRSGRAMVFFGVALAFKLQAIFLAPVILALCMRGAISWKSLMVVPGMLVLALVPAWMAGRPLGDLLNIYLYQASQFEFITMNAPSAYAWLPGSKQAFNLFYVPGVIMGGAAAYLLFVIVYKATRVLTKPVVLELGLAAMLIVPFFLPKMHERYFYPADILSIAFAFYYPQLFYIPILLGGVSFLSYQHFLFETEPIPLPVLTAVMLLAIGILFYHAMRQLFASANEASLNAGLASSIQEALPGSQDSGPSLP